MCNVSCSRCGQSLQNPVFVNGIPYGSDCAAKVMGLKELPIWFNEKSKEDFFVQKQKHEDLQRANKERHALSIEITNNAWHDYYLLSKAFVNLREQQNDWGINFISSIARQLGYPHLLQIRQCLFTSYEEAVKNWEGYMGTFPYFNEYPKPINCLSEKQQAILNRYI